MAAAVAQPVEHGQDCPPLDHGLRPESEPFDIDELCRRLEAYRLEVRLSQLRERSKALQQTATSNPTYKPRYSLIGEPKGFPDMMKADRSSRRQTRLFDAEKLKDLDVVPSKPEQSSEWINPKALLAARSHGLSEAEARESVQERDRKEQERTKAKKAMSRRSFAFLESSGAKTSSMQDPAARKRRPMSVAFNNLSAPDFRSWTGHGVRTFSPDSPPPIPDVPKQEARPKHKHRLPKQDDRNDWAQADEPVVPISATAVATSKDLANTDNAVNKDHATFRQKLAKRRSLFISNPPEPGPNGDVVTALPVPVAKDAAAEKRPTVPPARSSADSAIGMENDKKNATHEKDKTDRMLHLKRSIRDLFRRRRE